MLDVVGYTFLKDVAEGQYFTILRCDLHPPDSEMLVGVGKTIRMRKTGDRTAVEVLEHGVEKATLQMQPRHIVWNVGETP